MEPSVDFPILMRARLRHASFQAELYRRSGYRTEELHAYNVMLFALGVYPQELGLIEGQVH